MLFFFVDKNIEWFYNKNNIKIEKGEKMKKTIICISLCLCLLLALTAGASYPGVSYQDENYGIQNNDGTLTLKIHPTGRGIRTVYLDFTQPMEDYFEFKFNAVFPEADTDSWLSFVICDEPNKTEHIMFNSYPNSIIIQYRGFNENSEAFVSAAFSTNKQLQIHPWRTGTTDIVYSSVTAPKIIENQEHTFAFRKSEEYGITFEMDGVVYVDSETGKPMDFSKMFELWGENELYVGIMMYADWYPARVGAGPDRLRFNLLSVNNNLPSADILNVYNGEIPTASIPQISTPEPESSIVIDEGGSGCGNNA